MKIHDEIEQHRPEWHQMRIGKVTASELGNLVTADFSVRKGEMFTTYLAEKLAESWRGQPLPGFNVFDCEQGSILEEEAIPWFQLEYNVKIRQVGFIESDDSLSGCSPDGLIGDDLGVEIKCPNAQTHVKYLLGAVVPNQYLAQVHCSMFVTGYTQWLWVSYRRGFPQIVVKVDRNEEIIAKIKEAIRIFHERFNEGKKKIAEYQKA